MIINYPVTPPEGFTALHYPFEMTTNHSDEARAFIRDGALLFRLYNFSDEVQVTIELSDDRGSKRNYKTVCGRRKTCFDARK